MIDNDTPPASAVKSALPCPPRRRWVSLVLCTLIFAGGVVIGAGLAVLAPWEEWPPPKRTFQQRRDRLTERIAEKLDLRADQTAALRDIVEQRLENLEAIRRSILPKIEVEAEALNRQLTPLLTDEQAARWRDLYTTLHARWFAPPDENAATRPASAPAQP